MGSNISDFPKLIVAVSGGVGCGSAVDAHFCMWRQSHSYPESLRDARQPLVRNSFGINDIGIAQTVLPK
jgi:hypothetical protein